MIGTALAVLVVLLGATREVTVEGTVLSGSAPVAGARVRVRGTENVTETGADGRFVLRLPDDSSPVTLATSAVGHYVATVDVSPPAQGIEIRMRRHHTVDYEDYRWVSPLGGDSAKVCKSCHPEEWGPLPQWRRNAHGQAISNARVFSLYNGTDLSGHPAGDGYRKDFPGDNGECSACHAPGATFDPDLPSDLNSLRGRLEAGIHCDFCHKIGGVLMSPASGTMFPGSPGVLGLKMLRPPPDEDIFFGPFGERGGADTYLPLMRESAFCAPCHQYRFRGTPVYTSFDEWRASPYAERGVTCQHCHMPPTGLTRFARAEKGGLERPPERLGSHLQLGATDEAFLRDALTLSVEAERVGDEVVARVTLTNSGAGHHYPTDFPGRHLILTVSAATADGQPLELLEGPTVPEWGGPEARQAGKAFAKLLRDVETGAFPIVSYWRRTIIESDTRLPALAQDASTYRFATPPDAGEVRLQARVVLRRLFYEIAQQKAWDVPDIVVAEATAPVVAGAR